MASPTASQRESPSRLRRESYGESPSPRVPPSTSMTSVDKHGRRDASLTSDQLITSLGHNERLCQLHERHRLLQLHHGQELELPPEAIPNPAFLSAMDRLVWLQPYDPQPEPTEADGGADEVAAPPPSPRRPSSPPPPPPPAAPLREQQPASLVPAPGMSQAADSFDARHAARASKAEAVLQSAMMQRHDPRRREVGPRDDAAHSFDRTLQEVGRNRYVPPVASPSPSPSSSPSPSPEPSPSPKPTPNL